VADETMANYGFATHKGVAIDDSSTNLSKKTPLLLPLTIESISADGT